MSKVKRKPAGGEENLTLAQAASVCAQALVQIGKPEYGGQIMELEFDVGDKRVVVQVVMNARLVEKEKPQ